MKAEPEFDLLEFLRAVRRKRIRCLLIGRWAVAQHGAPVVTADYDFWVDSRHRTRMLELLREDFGAELPERHLWRGPLVTAYVGVDKIDCFFARKIINQEGQVLEFEKVYARADRRHDDAAGLRFRIPCIEDLIALKKFTHDDPMKRERNLEDIRYLLTLARKKAGRGRKS